MIMKLGGGAGGELIIHAPAGVTVIAVNNGTSKTYSKVADASGIAVFKGLPEETYSVHITDGQQSTDPIQVTVQYKASANITWFQVQLHVTWPAGSTCRCTLGSTVLTAPNTSGSHTFTITTPGTWVVSCSNAYLNASQNAYLTSSGSATINLSYYKLLLGGGNTIIGLPGNTFPAAYWVDNSYVFVGNHYATTNEESIADHPTGFSTLGYSRLRLGIGVLSGYVRVSIVNTNTNAPVLQKEWTQSCDDDIDISNINLDYTIIRYNYKCTDQSPKFHLYRVEIY